MFGTLFIIVYPFLAYIPFRLGVTYTKAEVTKNTGIRRILSYLIILSILPMNILSGVIIYPIIPDRNYFNFLGDPIDKILLNHWLFSIFTLGCALFVTYLTARHYKNGRKLRFIIGIICMLIYSVISILAGFCTAIYRLYYGWDNIL